VLVGRELFEKFPVFRRSILEMDDVFRKSTGKPVIHDCGLLDRSSAPSLPEIWLIALVLPSIAMFQIALFDLLVTSGVAPKAMAVELAIICGMSFAPIEQLGGTMAAVGCMAEVMDEILLEYRRENPQCLVELAFSILPQPSPSREKKLQSMLSWLWQMHAAFLPESFAPRCLSTPR
jgi:hypothetical protein